VKYRENTKNPQELRLNPVFDLEDQELIKRAQPLGTNARSFTPPHSMRPTAISAVKQAKNLPPEESSRIYRAERYWLQNSARRLLLREGVKENLQYPANYHKTAKCHHTRFGSDVEVHLSKEYNKAFYAGLVVCGKVFACPVCAAKVQERRRVEIAKVFDHVYGTMENKKIIMVTFTFPHYWWDNLNDLLTKQASAYAGLRGGDPWKRIKKRMGFCGLIRGFELTIGSNGWHPHTHEAWIVDADCDVENLLTIVSNRWHRMCSKQGLIRDGEKAQRHFMKHAVHMMDNCRTSDYFDKQGDVSNWGIDREIAKGASKQGDKSSKGAHPFALLREFSEGNQASGEKFLEYVKIMRDRRQRSVYFGQGVKALCGLNDTSDEELADKKEDSSDLLSTLSSDDWSVVIKNDHKSRILDIAETKGSQGLVDYFDFQRRSSFENQVIETEADEKLIREVESIGNAFVKKVANSLMSASSDKHQKLESDKTVIDDSFRTKIPDARPIDEEMRWISSFVSDG